MELSLFFLKIPLFALFLLPLSKTIYKTIIQQKKATAKYNSLNLSFYFKLFLKKLSNLSNGIT